MNVETKFIGFAVAYENHQTEPDTPRAAYNLRAGIYKTIESAQIVLAGCNLESSLINIIVEVREVDLG